VDVLGIKRGPWLFPALTWLGIHEALWLDLSRILLEELASCLKSLDLPNLHVVDTLARTTTMVPAAAGTTGDSNDWENEIHPNASGYTKLAATWAEDIASLPFP
jgi:lysophospholipase L1-like esterase